MLGKYIYSYYVDDNNGDGIIMKIGNLKDCIFFCGKCHKVKNYMK